MTATLIANDRRVVEPATPATLSPEKVRARFLKELSSKPKIPGANITFRNLGLEKLLTSEEVAQLVAEEREYLRLQEIITQNSPTLVRDKLQKLRADLLASGPFSQDELEAFTRSSKEELALADERNRIARTRAETHTRESVQPLVIKIFRKLMPKLERHVIDAERDEKALHSVFGIPTDYTPVANTVRERFESFRSQLEEMEQVAPHAPDGPRAKLGLLLDWSKIEPAK